MVKGLAFDESFGTSSQEILEDREMGGKKNCVFSCSGKYRHRQSDQNHGGKKKKRERKEKR